MKVYIFRAPIKNVTESVFVQELKKLGWDVQIFGAGIKTGYKKRCWLYFVGWPMIFYFAATQGLKALLSHNQPDVIIAGSHLEILPLVILKRILFKKRPYLVLLSFIYTKRRWPIHNTLRHLYFKALLSKISLIVCNSRYEMARYSQFFKNCKFAHVPYGLHIHEVSLDQKQESYVLSAGRSGRDYSTLIRVFSRLPYKLHIVCDCLNESPSASNIQVLRNCYGRHYLEELKGANLVVIPLVEGEISAGQMVLLQAMAYAKPIIITRTKTTEEYAKHLETAFFVNHGNEEELRQAVEYLLSSHDVTKKLGGNAARHFTKNYSMRAYARNLHNCLFRFLKV